jgi:hypothetical protein
MGPLGHRSSDPTSTAAADGPASQNQLTRERVIGRQERELVGRLLCPVSDIHVPSGTRVAISRFDGFDLPGTLSSPKGQGAFRVQLRTGQGQDCKQQNIDAHTSLFVGRDARARQPIATTMRTARPAVTRFPKAPFPTQEMK